MLDKNKIVINITFLVQIKKKEIYKLKFCFIHIIKIHKIKNVYTYIFYYIIIIFCKFL